jgi:hypothetical protein
MARPTETELERLIRLTEESRARLTVDLAVLKRRLDVPGQLRRSLRSHPTRWAGGSLLAGFAASMLFRRKKVVVFASDEPPPAGRRRRRRRSSGILGALFAMAGPLVMNFAKGWIRGQIRRYLANRDLFSVFSRGHPVDSGFPKSP